MEQTTEKRPGLVFRWLLRDRIALAGALIVVAISIAAIFAPLLSPEDPDRQNYDALLESPGPNHPLGTDRLGRDNLSRLLHGARTSMTVGVLTQFIVAAIGIPYGIAAGMTSARVDNYMMRFVDVVYAFPDLLLIILLRAVLGDQLTGVFGGGVLVIMLAMGLVSWPTVARIVRGQTLSLKERDYVLAARSVGASETRIMLRHILPNSLGPVFVALAFLIPKAIFAEATLSFIGIGVASRTPSWGTMIQEGYEVIFASYTPVLFPALAIGLLMLGFAFLGYGLRNLLNPRPGRLS